MRNQNPRKGFSCPADKTEENAICSYGCGQKASYRVGEKYCCSEYINKCSMVRSKNGNRNRIIRTGKKLDYIPNPDGNKNLKGKTYEQYFGKEKSDLIKSKITNASLKRSHSDETKKRLSEVAKKKGFGGSTRGGGRGKKGWYKGFWCDSSWELAYIIYNLDHGIEFKRNTEKFDYEYQGKIKRWIPDFIEKEGYIEIKGYKTEQVEAKIKGFTKPLKVLMKDDLGEIFRYVIEKHGKNFTKLYNGERAGR